MGVCETSPAAVTPLLLRNLITSLFIFADKSLFNLAKKHKLLEFIHRLFISSFLFFLRFLPSIFSYIDHVSNARFPLKPPKNVDYATVSSGTGSGSADLGISRALTQLLSIINLVPVSSRKYEVVRSLAERIIDDNHREGIGELREVNRAVLSAAFDRTIREIEVAMVGLGFRQDDDGGSGSPAVDYSLYRVLRAVRSLGNSARIRLVRMREGASETGTSAEKLAAELLWLAEKMVSCGYSNEACSRWASAAHLGRGALSAEPRLQGSLVKVAAFLFKQVRDMEMYEDEEESKKQQWRQTKMRMLISWLPLLCRGSNGMDAPVLSMGERHEVETVLEETIGTLGQDEQEQVLGLWLHHFTLSSSSDCPNLHASYARWYNASRKLLIYRDDECHLHRF